MMRRLVRLPLPVLTLTALAASGRERLSPNEGWLFHKDDPAGNTVDLRYDTIERPGEIVATDNGDPRSFEPFPSPTREAFSGLCLVIVRAKPGQAGLIRVTAAGKALSAATTTITTTADAPWPAGRSEPHPLRSSPP